MKHDERRLPQWAQKTLFELRGEITKLRREITRIKSAGAPFSDYEWFTIPGPDFDECEHRELFILNVNRAHPVCSLGKGDKLLVLRAPTQTGEDEP